MCPDRFTRAPLALLSEEAIASVETVAVPAVSRIIKENRLASQTLPRVAEIKWLEWGEMK